MRRMASSASPRAAADSGALHTTRSLLDLVRLNATDQLALRAKPLRMPVGSRYLRQDTVTR